MTIHDNTCVISLYIQTYILFISTDMIHQIIQIIMKVADIPQDLMNQEYLLTRGTCTCTYMYTVHTPIDIYTIKFSNLHMYCGY